MSKKTLIVYRRKSDGVFFRFQAPKIPVLDFVACFSYLMEQSLTGCCHFRRIVPTKRYWFQFWKDKWEDTDELIYTEIESMEIFSQ